MNRKNVYVASMPNASGDHESVPESVNVNWRMCRKWARENIPNFAVLGLIWVCSAVVNQ